MSGGNGQLFSSGAGNLPTLWGWRLRCACGRDKDDRSYWHGRDGQIPAYLFPLLCRRASTGGTGSGKAVQKKQSRWNRQRWSKKWSGSSSNSAGRAWIISEKWTEKDREGEKRKCRRLEHSSPSIQAIASA